MKLALLSGGVGGGRLARGLSEVPDVDLTVIVNVGDDERVYGLAVSPDIDTVIYTMAGREGPHGWGLRDDHFDVMEALDALPIDSTFQIGDRDIATNLFRTDRLAAGWSLTWVTTALASAFGVKATILPATDDPLRTQVKIQGGAFVSFQEYFVTRHHADDVEDVRFDGAGFSRPAPGVIEAIETCDALLIGPSNPILSIWPILAIPAIGEAVAAKGRLMAVSPLIGGAAVKGPAHRVLSALGFGASTAGVVASYGGLLTDIVVDATDANDRAGVGRPRMHVTDTRMPDLTASVRLAQTIVDLLSDTPGIRRSAHP
jgi:LPPG:FO 2-phospho-L-lactate transferase